MSGLVKHVEDLDVFRFAYALATEIHPWSLTLPKTEQYSGLADQIRRSSRSVCANLVEGFGRQASAADFRHYTVIAKGSANATLLWIRFAGGFGYASVAQTDNWAPRYQQVCRMLQGLADTRKR